MSDPILRWFTPAVVLFNLFLQRRRWRRKRKGIAYEPITRLKLNG